MSIVIGAIIALGVLVTFHEFGHFIIARKCGVEVLRFSIGFGKPLVSWHDRHGTEFVIAMIPLGGYVKMLDEREADTEIPPEKRAYSFNAKSVEQRMAIVAAGPIANFILAFFLFWVVALIGSKEAIPFIGKVEPNSIAAVAGLTPKLEILEVDGVVTETWGEVALQLFKRLGESGTITIVAKEQAAQIKTYQLTISDWLKGAKKPNPFEGLGIAPDHPIIVPKVFNVRADTPAQSALLQKGDIIKSFNGKSLTDWYELSDAIKKAPRQTVTLGYERQGRLYQVEVTLGLLPDTTDIGFLGVEPEISEWPDTMLRTVRDNPMMGIKTAAWQTWSFSVMTLSAVKKMLTGQMSVKNLSGPITIAKVAGASVDSGLVSFLKFLALFSVSLGVFNLLPIPILDGGHLLFFAIEKIRGRPVSEEIQGAALQVGVFLMLGVMLFAIMNDLSWL